VSKKGEMQMEGQNAAFIGSVPENYDRFMGPLFFEPYGDDLAKRLPRLESGQVLEIACGTGISTKHLRNALSNKVKLVATDLNEPMINMARGKFTEDSIEWKQADATRLPFPDQSFQAVVCQFGVMFFPDKEAAFREAYRVLSPGGTFLFNVWDSLEKNPLSKLIHETVAAHFKDNPPNFYNVPFGLYDSAVIRSLLERAGFSELRSEVVTLDTTSPSAEDAATGLVQGTPLIAQIAERKIEDLPTIHRKVVEAISSNFGDRPVRSKMQAIIWSATRK
jgi:ubiquinone/menaquinone biosynthesis C-methylase UbiE/uncharacterized protein YneF (UPF0154 family)